MRAEQKIKLGNDEVKKGNFFEALLRFSEAIGIVDKPQFYLKRCECLMHMKDYENAICDALRAIETDQSYRVSYYHAMDCYLLMGDTQNADGIIKVFREIAPNIDSIDKNQVPKCEKLKDLREDIVDFFASNSQNKCLDCIIEALKIAPANVDLQFMKLRCLVILQRLQEAEKVNLELCSLVKQQFDFTKALKFYYDGDIDGCVKLFSKISKELRRKVKPLDDVTVKAARFAAEIAKGEKT